VDTLRFVPEGADEARYNEIFQWQDGHRFEAGKFASRDSDFKAIRKSLSADKSDPAPHELSDFEEYEFPGGFLRGTDTDELAKVRSEEQAARRQGSWAMTRWPDVA